eukprot:2407542-Amphidinium_carterae.5
MSSKRVQQKSKALKGARRIGLEGDMFSQLPHSDHRLCSSSTFAFTSARSLVRANTSRIQLCVKRGAMFASLFFGFYWTKGHLNFTSGMTSTWNSQTLESKQNMIHEASRPFKLVLENPDTIVLRWPPTPEPSCQTMSLFPVDATDGGFMSVELRTLP